MLAVGSICETLWTPSADSVGELRHSVRVIMKKAPITKCLFKSNDVLKTVKMGFSTTLCGYFQVVGCSEIDREG